MQTLRLKLRVFLLLTVVILFGGTIGFMVLEKLSFGDALYFCVVTVTTVGYGDISPSGTMSKMLAVVVILGGIGAFTGVVANATELLLSRHEHIVRQQKLHMVRGLFFSEIGGRLLRILAFADPLRRDFARDLAISVDWDRKRFSKINTVISKHSYKLDPDILDFTALLDLLETRGDFLLRLLENQSLLEEEGFTEALRSVFHLRDEMEHRKGISPLPASDVAHLCGDANRAYRQLTYQWLDYVEYLKEHYPYLFSLAVRTNPFVETSSPVVVEG